MAGMDLSRFRGMQTASINSGGGALDRKIPDNDHDPLRNALDWTDPMGAIADAAGEVGEQIRKGIIKVVKDVAGIDLSSWDAFLASLADGKGIDLPIVLEILQRLVGLVDDLTSGRWLPKWNVPTAQSPNLLPEQNFAPGSIAPGSEWDDSLGFANVVANGRLHALRSGRDRADKMPVAVGQKITETVQVWHTDLEWSGVPVQMMLVPFLGDVALAPVEMVAYMPAEATIETPIALTGTWTVPEGVDGIQVKLYVTREALAGDLFFDFPSVTQSTPIYQDQILGLPESFQEQIARWQLLLDTMVNSLTKAGTIANSLEALADAMKRIPFANIDSALGAMNLGDDVADLLNALVGGAVGKNGTGATKADAYNIFKMLSEWANRGDKAKEITDTRTNTKATGGLGISERSNFDLGLANSWIEVTPTASAIGFDYIEGDMPLGVVSWIGYGVTGITAVYVNVWKVDLATGALTWSHASGNVVGILAGAGEAAPGKFIQYELPAPVNLKISELFGYEIIVVGGTHHIRGRVYDLPEHPTAPIAKLAATRNASASPGSPPSSIAKSSIVWSDNAPWVGIAVDTGNGAGYHDPQQIYLGSEPTTIPIPDWCGTVLGVVVGDGGGAHLGGSWGFAGDPGEPGKIATVAWERGVDFSGATIVTSDPGPGGTPGSNPLSQNGGDGQGSTLSIPGHSITADGGEGGKSIRNVLLGGAKPVGSGPAEVTGNIFTFGDYQFRMGGPQNAYGGDGIAPGGAANGGDWMFVSAGGRGAPGGAWVVFLPSEGGAPTPPDTTPPGAPTVALTTATPSTITISATGDD